MRCWKKKYYNYVVTWNTLVCFQELYPLRSGFRNWRALEILILWLNKTRGLVMLSRGFCNWEKFKVLVESGSGNLKSIRDGYINRQFLAFFEFWIQLTNRWGAVAQLAQLFGCPWTCLCQWTGHVQRAPTGDYNSMYSLSMLITLRLSLYWALERTQCDSHSERLADTSCRRGVEGYSFVAIAT